MSEWISVDEELPQLSSPASGMIYVLVWCDNKKEAYKGVRLGSEHDFFWGCYPGSAIDADVTHWMPLPEPPSA